MIRFSFDLRKDSVISLNNYLEDVSRSDIKSYPLNTGEYKYRYMYLVDYGGVTMSVGISLNGDSKDDYYKGFVEVNPNKCFSNPQCTKDISYIRYCSSVFEVVRWDLAIDVPVPRREVHLHKDNRRFELIQLSEDNKTEYLGQRNKPGRFKLYNKSLELELEKDLTRMELTVGTLDTSYRDILSCFPKVWISSSQHSLLLTNTLSANDQVLLKLLRSVDDPDYYFRQLTYRMRKKIEPHLFTETQFKVNKKSILVIINGLEEFVKGY